MLRGRRRLLLCRLATMCLMMEGRPDARTRAPRSTPQASPNGEERGRAARRSEGSLGARTSRERRGESSYLSGLGRWDQPCEERIAFVRGLECGFAGAGEFVVLARGALFGVGDGLLLPVRADEVVALETAQGRVDGSAGEAGHLHDAEAVDVAGMDGLEDHRGGVREFRLGCHAGNCTYVACYLTSGIVVCYIGWVEDALCSSCRA